MSKRAKVGDRHRAERPEYGGADTPRWFAMLAGGTGSGGELGILAALWATVRDAYRALRVRLRG